MPNGNIRIEAGGASYGPDETEALRSEMVVLRDEALNQADFKWSVTLSHLIAWMAGAKALLWPMRDCPGCKGSGFSGQGTGHGDVCGTCGGTKQLPQNPMLCTFGPPDERKQTWVLVFEDNDMGDCVFKNEEDAMTAFKRAADNWNCTLLVTAELKP